MKNLIHSTICVILVFALGLLCGCGQQEPSLSYHPDPASSTPARTAENQQEENISSDGTSGVAASGNSSSVAHDQKNATNTSNEDIYVSTTLPHNETQNSALPEISAETSSDKTSSASVHTHSWTVQTVAAKCTERGYTVRTCACGKSNKTDYTAALGHNWSSWTTVKSATVTSDGREERVCSVCRKTESRSIDKLTDTADNVRQEILNLVNAERSKAGLSPLAYYTAGQAAADTRAEEIGQVFSHTRPNGSSCFTVFGENGISYRAAGENIAYGYRSAESVMEGWMNSEGHRANILNENFTHIVVGVDGTNWVQLFITPYSR